jgi:type VI secretion system secreted protein VgrG
MTKQGAPSPLPIAEFGFQSQDAPGPWHVRRFLLKESLGGMYSAHVDLIHDDPDPDFFALDGSPCTLTVSRGPLVTRQLHGLARHTTLDGWDTAGQTLVSIEIVPAFAFLETGRDLRWFRGKTAPDILRQVLSDGLGRYNRDIDLGNLTRMKADPEQDLAYVIRETCAQYHESDFAFARRLMEDEGITALYDHSGKAEKLVLVDSNSAFPKYQEHLPVRLIPASAGIQGFEALSSFRIRTNPTPARVIVKDHDLTRPLVPFAKQMQPEPPDADGAEPAAPQPYTQEERYRFPAGLTFTRQDTQTGAYKGSDLDVRARQFFEESQAMARLGLGVGDVSGFAAGQTFVLESGHPLIDGKYLLTRVVHHGVAGGQGAETDSGDPGLRYWNEFECIPLGTTYRPPRRTPKPVAHLDRAITMGPPGSDDIHVDKRGYVKVNFAGNREDREEDEPDGRRSAWIPVAQGWLGAGMGQRITPRKGMEVLVGYQEGDPDRPVVLACLPTGVNSIPYPLPGEKTRTVFFRTASTPAGEPNFSELSVDDARGKEQMLLRVARDLDKQVLHDERTEISHDETRTVGNGQTLHVKGSRALTVDKDDAATVHGNRAELVNGNAEARIGKNETRTVGGDRATMITGNEGLAVHGNRDAKIDGDDLVDVAHDRTVRVNHTLTVVQGETTVEWTDGHVDLTAGSWIRIRHSSAEVYIDEDGKIYIATTKDLEMTGENIKIAGKKVSIEATEELTLASGSGAMKLDAEGAAVSGNKVRSSGVAMNEITGAVVKLN